MYLTNLLIREDIQSLSLMKARLNTTKLIIKHDKKALQKDVEYFFSTPKGLLSSFAAGSLVSIMTEREKHTRTENTNTQEQSEKSKKESLLANIPWATLLTAFLKI
mgnify:FL=1